MAAPLLGMLAGLAGRAALGPVGRSVVAGGMRSTAMGRLRRMAGRRIRRRRARGMRMHQAYGRYGTSFKRFRAASRRAYNARNRQSQQDGGFYQNQNQQQPGQGFSNAGNGQGDPDQAKQQISQFGNTLARASMVLGAFTGAIGLAVTAVKALHGFASVLVDSQRGTARYSGTMSAAAAGLEVGRIGREMQTAQNTGGSFVKLTQSLDKLERAMQPFRELFTNTLNEATTTLIDIATPLVRGVSSLIPILGGMSDTAKDWYYWIKAGGNQQQADKLRAIDEWNDKQARHFQRMQAQMNFGDLMALRANVAVANGVNKPNPNIPNQPQKGGRPGNPANPAPPPAVLRIGP